MRWDDTHFSGERSGWQWFVSRRQIVTLQHDVIREHLGKRLWITTFDSGPITPNSEELLAGWQGIGGAMVSPPLEARLEIPRDQNDEWYIFNDDYTRNHHFERFVVYGGFTLADPRALADSFDPTWERDSLDWLYPLQRRFWNQIDQLTPITYIAMGDNDIVVTRDHSFANSVRQSINK
jgi:hypothetical protein